MWSPLPGCGARMGRLWPARRLRETWSEWPDGPTCPSDRFTFTGFFLLSGIYDLEPLVHTSQNAPLLLTPEDAQRISPQRLLEAAPRQPADPACRVLVIVGQHDSPEFLRQSREFYQTLCRGGWRASFEELQDVDHFEIVWKLTQKDYVLNQVGMSLRWDGMGPRWPLLTRRGGEVGGRGARKSHFPGLFGVQEGGGPAGRNRVPYLLPPSGTAPGDPQGLVLGARVGPSRGCGWGEAGARWYPPVRVSA
ncbi:arylformamidase [Phyllostomus discolor]|uniref:Arylformamidase n=1 Tax=Phyllostomus discolor TaxID=89673 RepID=A0A833ZIK1_9CHIR|nr:arylformamidase [Phyllostomus discolor]